MSDVRNEIFNSGQQRIDSAGVLTFDIPVIDVPLPSQGKVYKTEHPLFEKGNVTITAMTAAQENILTNKSLAKRGTLMSQLIQSCLSNRTINARELLIGDRSTIMVALRISGYGSEYKIKVVCPSCDESSVQTFDLSQLPIKLLQIDPAVKGENIFEFTLPMSKARVLFKFLTGVEEEEIAMTQTNKKKAGAGLADSDLVTSGLLHSIVSINGVSDRVQIATALPRMPAFDSQALRRHIQDNEPGMQLKSTMVCPGCDYTGEVDMPLGASFFWPGSD